MTLRTVVVSTVAASILAVSPVVYAAPSALHLPVHAMFGKSKMIKIHLRNDSHQLMELKVGEETMKIEAGKIVDAHVPAGTRIVATANTPMHKEGELIAQITPDLEDATIGIK